MYVLYNVTMCNNHFKKKTPINSKSSKIQQSAIIYNLAIILPIMVITAVAPMSSVWRFIETGNCYAVTFHKVISSGKTSCQFARSVSASRDDLRLVFVCLSLDLPLCYNIAKR